MTDQNSGSLQTGVNATGATPSSRKWLRLLFEAQARAYTPTGPGQPLTGWIFWSWKTEDDINTWSYRRGIAQGYIVADATNSSQYVYPLLENGCVDSTYNYTAPATVPNYNAPDNTKKSSATSLERLSSWSLIPAALALVWPLCL
jgi:glucan 1,3-beta-glucosidase